MITNWKKLLIVVPIIFLGFFVFSFDVNAATCVLKNATWNKSRADAGETVKITVNGENCNGWGVAVKIWEKDFSDPDDLTDFNVTLNFPGNSSTLTTSWVAENSYDLTGDNQFYIEANAGESKIYSYNGGIIPYLYVATGGGPNGGPQITSYDVNPKSLPSSAGAINLSYTFKFHLDDPAAFKTFCGGNARWEALLKWPEMNDSFPGQGNFSITTAKDYDFSFSKSQQITSISNPLGRPTGSFGRIKCGSYQKESELVSFSSSGGGQKYKCNSSNQCVADSNGTYTTSNCDNKCSSSSGGDQSYTFNIPNPLKGGAENLSELVGVLALWIFNLAIPIAVAMIVYAGVMFLISRGEPAKIIKAKQILLYAVVGLAIILIGRGFITLIKSILKLGAGS